MIMDSPVEIPPSLGSRRGGGRRTGEKQGSAPSPTPWSPRLTCTLLVL